MAPKSLTLLALMLFGSVTFAAPITGEAPPNCVSSNGNTVCLGGATTSVAFDEAYVPPKAPYWWPKDKSYPEDWPETTDEWKSLAALLDTTSGVTSSTSWSKRDDPEEGIPIEFPNGDGKYGVSGLGVAFEPAYVPPKSTSKPSTTKAPKSTESSSTKPGPTHYSTTPKPQPTTWSPKPTATKTKTSEEPWEPKPTKSSKTTSSTKKPTGKPEPSKTSKPKDGAPGSIVTSITCSDGATGEVWDC